MVIKEEITLSGILLPSTRFFYQHVALSYGCCLIPQTRIE
ncbi:hypothetical protein HMPREF0758_3326 [Serratia odorifera DSM 4582]|uniref:Uncharacterized protein n=1 Tax=Serratia odorifera DSM 4582 TaxID=667129 RepID=D4E576_SEROD|nr:hypothetical protein HMPREF0758_3326 [Serratia odorifera DSM 4582]